MMFNNLPQECVEIIMDFLSFEDIQKVEKLFPQIQDKNFFYQIQESKENIE